jgi:hypothetical protein
VILMLILIALISLILGMGIPTTANYILVATLMAPVVVELAGQAGLAIPLIAVHLFVFYFGIMADITPPVGLAAFAAAAISREDPIATGLQGSVYALRTAILPFVFIFNPVMLLIGLEDWWHATLAIVGSLTATLVFAAATMGYFVTRSRWWETALLLIVCFALFRPDWFINQVHAPTVDLPAAQLFEQVARTPQGGRVVFRVEGVSIEGKDVRKTVSLTLRSEQPDPRERLRDAGLTVVPLGEELTIGNVAFGSPAQRARLEPGYLIAAVVAPAPDRPSAEPIYLAAFALLALVWWVQRRRSAPADKAAEARHREAESKSGSG